MKNLPIAVLLLVIACVSASAGGSWRNDELKRQAASDLACTRDALSTYESSSQAYSVRGCGKRALYRLQNCNRVTRECRFVLEGEITNQ